MVGNIEVKIRRECNTMKITYNGSKEEGIDVFDLGLFNPEGKYSKKIKERQKVFPEFNTFLKVEAILTEKILGKKNGLFFYFDKVLMDSEHTNSVIRFMDNNSIKRKDTKHYLMVQPISSEQIYKILDYMPIMDEFIPAYSGEWLFDTVFIPKPSKQLFFKNDYWFTDEIDNLQAVFLYFNEFPALEIWTKNLVIKDIEKYLKTIGRDMDIDIVPGTDTKIFRNSK